ncbi:hypothetical protein ABZU76_46320 [Amycolatopsis sp. NPDC005232]|uniref:ATP-dependent DNA ligase n=1 Tax=Amycolatopsis sp. NPDC005232 TaxID=3157027 RepID=UPI0033B1F93C
MRLPLAQPAREVPVSRPGWSWAYETKLDGWRALLFAELGLLQSRQDSDLADRFPEVVAAGAQLGDVVLDGEIVALRAGRLDFGALAARPAARAKAGVSVYFAVFDLLADGPGDDLRSLPYRDRRAQLEQLLAGVAPPLQLVHSTTDRDAALAWTRPEASDVGIEGVIAKLLDARYRPGRTDAWVKVRQVVVVDAVVVGVAGDSRAPSEVVLARRDGTGAWRQIGLSLPLEPRLGRQIGAHATLTGEPAVYTSAGGFGRGRTQYLPVRPEVVVVAETDPAVETFASRQRPRVHRARLDPDAADVPPGRGESG